MQDYPLFEISHARCAGRVALHGAHVTSWCPVGEREVLYLSPDAVFAECKALRGGIPICWPWFNRHPIDPTLPSHGIARTRFWEFVHASEDEHGVALRFSMTEGAWSAAVTVFMGGSLEVSLESHNPSGFPLAISGALHPYLAVDDVRRLEIAGLESCDYLDTVGPKTRRRQDGPLLIDREVDRIYDCIGDVAVSDLSAGRVISIGKTGSPSTVIWNPWMEKAADLTDMPDDGYLHFVCVEAAIANEKAIVLPPGGKHLLSTRIELLEI